jgi:hypothetical protein
MEWLVPYNLDTVDFDAGKSVINEPDAAKPYVWRHLSSSIEGQGWLLRLCSAAKHLWTISRCNR